MERGMSAPMCMRRGRPCRNALGALALVAIALWTRPLAGQANMRLFQEACDAGDFYACNVFGLMLESGDGVLRDIERAAELYRRACEGGEMSGCTNLGMLYEAGSGVPQDSARARGLLRVACEGGQALACEEVGPLEQVAAGELTGGFNKVGRVRDEETGRPLSDAIVDIPELEVRAISNAQGRLQFLGLPPGTYLLRAQRVGYETLEADLEILDDAEFAVPLTPATRFEPGERSRILGRVHEPAGGALSGVEITVVDQTGARTLSDQEGDFSLGGIEAGLLEVRFTLLGYAPRTAMVVVQPGSTTEITVTMATEPIELEPIEVVVRSSFLERSGYYARSQLGTQFSRNEIERLAPTYVSDLVRRAAGVRLQGGAAVGARFGNFAGRPCTLPMYIDGVRSVSPELDRFRPEEIEAIEVFQGVNTPIEYSNSCGVVLVWTRRGG